jgi:hypothetical protein
MFGFLQTCHFRYLAPEEPYGKPQDSPLSPEQSDAHSTPPPSYRENAGF